MLGVKVLEETHSDYNGKIEVIKTFEGTRIVVGGLSQSGWLVKKVWKAALDKIKKLKPNAENILLLGLGGGSAMELVQNYWPNSKKVGIDIDRAMIDMGMKYLKLGEVQNLKVIVGDAKDWVAKNKDKKRFDIVLVDMYKGANIPETFRSQDFMEQVRSLVKPGGIAAFNHLYSWVEKEDAHKFEENLNQVFAAKTIVKPEANIIFVCYT